jgi:two-component system KDP operon response regulator KdpE
VAGFLQVADVSQRVLVVGDEPQSCALGTTLRGAGFTVDTATTVETAHFTRPPIRTAAVILDLVLPDGSGTDVCRGCAHGARRRSSSSPPSAGGGSEALDAGADDYVTKPFSVDELLARLRAVLPALGEPPDR